VALTKLESGLIFSDAVDRADSSDLGGDWIERAGDWAIADNRFSITSTTTSVLEHGADPAGEMFVQARFGGTSQTTFNNHGLLARYEWNGGSNNGYLLRYNAAFGALNLVRVVNGSSTSIATGGVAQRSTDSPMQLYVGQGVQHGRIRGTTGWVSRSASDETFDAATDRTFAHSAQSYGAQSVTKTSWAWLRCTSKFIRVTNLGELASWRVRVIGPGDVTALTVAAVGSEALVDVMQITALDNGVPLGGFAALIVEMPDGDGWTELERYDADGVYPGDEYEFDATAEIPPSKPVVSAEAFGVSITASTSAMVSPGPDAQHTETQWQIAPATGTDWDNPTIDILTDEFLTAIILEDGLAPDTAYVVRARHFDGELVSVYSDPVAVTTEAAANPPAQPTATVTDQGPDFVEAESSEYAHPAYTIIDPDTTDPEDLEPDESGDLPPVTWFGALQWQVRLASAGDWTSPVYDSGPASAEGGLQVVVSDLSDDTAYQIRVRHQDGFRGVWGPWSDPAPFTTDEISPVAPDAPTVTITACERDGFAVTSSAYTHDESTPHQSTQWRLGLYGTFEESGTLLQATTETLTDPAPLFEFAQSQIDGGTYGIEARYRDTLGRWGPWSAIAWCEVRREPAMPEFTTPASGAVVNVQTVVAWDMAFEPDDGDWVYTVQFSDDHGASWELLADDLTEPEFLFDPSPPANGSYMVRVRACYSVDATDCGEWSYLFLTVDRTGLRSFAIDFRDYDTMPETWEVKIREANVAWALRKDLFGNTEGLWGRAASAYRYASALAFTEIGEPVAGDFTATFSFLTRHNLWYGWRFAHMRFTRAGTAFRMVGSTEDLPRQHVSGDVNFGASEAFPIGGFPVGDDPCGCGLHTEGVCLGRLGGKRVWLDRHDHASYAKASANPGVALRGRRWNQSFQGLFRTGSAPHAGPRRGGATASYLVPNDAIGDPRSCIEVRPQYTVRTQVRRSAGGYRIRVKMVGPGLDPTSGWHVDEEVANLDENWLCGYCGVIMENFYGIAVTDGILFTSYTASNLEYGPCGEPPLGCIEGWRYTDFEDDDITPTYGEADEFGNVIEADYYTNKDCPRPYLKIPQDFSDTDVDFVAGATTIGAITVEILDKRTDPADQSTGIVTAKQEGRQGRRGVLERWRDDLGWVTVFDGVVQDTEISEGTNIVTVRRHLRDPRERERRADLFARNETFSVYPELGPIDPYAALPQGGHLIPAAPVASGTFVRDLAIGIPSGSVVLSEPILPEFEAIQWPTPRESLWAYTELTVRWRPLGSSDPWTYRRDMVVSAPQSIISYTAGGVGPFPPGSQPRLFMSASDFIGTGIPEDQQEIEFQVLAVRTTDATPFLWDRGTFGDLLLEIYDGEHTNRPPKIRFNRAAVEAWAEDTPRARFILRAPAGNIREWVERHIFAPLAHAPALDPDYRLFPLSGLLPPGGIDLVEVTPDEAYPVGDVAARHRQRRQHHLLPLHPGVPGGG
jgi:hypothetical protein